MLRVLIRSALLNFYNEYLIELEFYDPVKVMLSRPVDQLALSWAGLVVQAVNDYLSIYFHHYYSMNVYCHVNVFLILE